MIAAFLGLPRPVRTAIIGVAAFAVFVIAFTVWRSMDRRDAVSDAAAEVEAKAAPARETAATERVNDTLTIQDRQKERDHAAEAIPDSRPDDRELRRRCRQLRDSGRTPAACAGLEVQSKPVPSDDVLTSRVAGEQYDNAVEAWGEAGWAQVGRLCRFFDEVGMKGLDCPAPTGPPPDPG